MDAIARGCGRSTGHAIGAVVVGATAARFGDSVIGRGDVHNIHREPGS